MALGELGFWGELVGCRWLCPYSLRVPANGQYSGEKDALKKCIFIRKEGVLSESRGLLGERVFSALPAAGSLAEGQTRSGPCSLLLPPFRKNQGDPPSHTQQPKDCCGMKFLYLYQFRNKKTVVSLGITGSGCRDSGSPA